MNREKLSDFSKNIIDIHRVALDAIPDPADEGCENVIRDVGVLETLSDYLDGYSNGDALENAARILHDIAAFQAFYNGNKRTAFLAADLYLRESIGMRIDVSPEEKADFLASVVDGKQDRESVRSWLACHIQKVE